MCETHIIHRKEEKIWIKHTLIAFSFCNCEVFLLFAVIGFSLLVLHSCVFSSQIEVNMKISSFDTSTPFISQPIKKLFHLLNQRDQMWLHDLYIINGFYFISTSFLYQQCKYLQTKAYDLSYKLRYDVMAFHDYLVWVFTVQSPLLQYHCYLTTMTLGRNHHGDLLFQLGHFASTHLVLRESLCLMYMMNISPKVHYSIPKMNAPMKIYWDTIWPRFLILKLKRL